MSEDHTAEREAFEAWYSAEDQETDDPERTYELTEEGMNELTKYCVWQGWQARAAAPAQERIQALELEVRQLTEQIAGLRYAPTPQADSQPAPVLDMAVMQLAESVGLIGPASRGGDLHAAIQRFHDLICVNATIKAAVMAADAIRGAAAPAQDYPPLPMQFACSGVFPAYSADQMRAYVDADRAARAPADSVLEDAARYLFLRDGKWRDTDLEPVILLQLNSLWDAKIDAARKQGANHDL